MDKQDTPARSIYDPAPRLMSNDELEQTLRRELIGTDLSGLALRSRSKEIKLRVCAALGYPAPRSFKKTHPRFPCQNLDVMTQKSNNIQIWNSEIDPDRRYALCQVDATDTVCAVRVVTGAYLSSLDTTGTATHKYQAILSLQFNSGVYSSSDTTNITPWLQRGALNQAQPGTPVLANIQLKLNHPRLPTEPPHHGQVLPIHEVYNRLCPLIGLTIPELSKDQERNRGSLLHQHVCRALGYQQYRDNGQFPDIPNQLLEIKLQTAPTIDLGKYAPNSELEVLPGITCSDIRYAIFYGIVHLGQVTLQKVFLVNGHDFFTLAQPVPGVNKKLQMHLPLGFFSR